MWGAAFDGAFVGGGLLRLSKQKVGINHAATPAQSITQQPP